MELLADESAMRSRNVIMDKSERANRTWYLFFMQCVEGCNLLIHRQFAYVNPFLACYFVSLLIIFDHKDAKARAATIFGPLK